MSRKKKQQQKKSKKRFTPIAQQKRSGSALTTSLSDLGMEMIDWERDLMPDHIWIDLLANEYKELN